MNIATTEVKTNMTLRSAHGRTPSAPFERVTIFIVEEDVSSSVPARITPPWTLAGLVELFALDAAFLNALRVSGPLVLNV
jgi:hypothetical protein